MEKTDNTILKNKFNFRAIIKFVITLFYLISSIWSTYLIFTYMLHNNIDETGNPMENTALILLYSVSLSALFIFLLGMLSIFTHFVYIKLIYGDEIRNAAYILLKRKRVNKTNSNKPDINSTENIEQIND